MAWAVAAALYLLGAYSVKDTMSALSGPQRGGAGYDGAVESWAHFYRKGGRPLVDKLDRIVTRTMIAGWPVVMVLSVCIDLHWAWKGGSKKRG